MTHPLVNWDNFEKFCDRVGGRVQVGAKAYGNASFMRPADELVGEIEEELLDVCGWAFVLWTRLRHLRAVLPQAPEPPPPPRRSRPRRPARAG